MKITTQIFHSTWCAMALAVAACASAQAQTQDLQAVVRNVSGNVMFNVEGQPSLPLRSGARLSAGAVIRTGIGSSADLFLGRGNGTVRIQENTVLGIDKLQSSDLGSEILTDTLLTLVEGEILGAANRLSGASHYEIKLPTGLLGIRGARFRVRVPGGIALLDGTAVYAGDGKSKIMRGPSQLMLDNLLDVQPLPENEVSPLREQLRNLGAASSQQAGPQARQLIRPQPQELPLSPVVGG